MQIANVEAMKAVRWVSAHLATPADHAVARETFWAMVTHTHLQLAPTKQATPHRDAAVYVPASGDVCLYATAQDALEPDLRLTLHARNVKALLAEGARRGGRVLEEGGDYGVVMSPAGLIWHAALWDGQKAVPAPAPISPEMFEGYEVAARADQISMDVPAQLFDAEVEYWADLLGWKVIDAARPEYVVLVDKAMPFRLMLHRDPFRDVSDPATIHLDISGGGPADVDRLLAWHRSLGARQLTRQPWWIEMVDPAGGRYCLTRRDPSTGAIQAR